MRYPVGHCPESTLAIIALYFEKKDDADLDFLSVKVITPPLMINPFFFSHRFFFFLSFHLSWCRVRGNVLFWHTRSPGYKKRVQGGSRVFYFFRNFSKSHWKKSLRFKFFQKVTEKCRWNFKSPLFVADFWIFVCKKSLIFSKVQILSLIFK